MHWHVWFEFVVVSALIGLVPGPGVASIVGYALGSGRATALASVAGMSVGNAVAIGLSLAGVGAILAASPFAFGILKWAGAAYLVGMGIATIAKSKQAGSAEVRSVPIKPRVAFANNIGVGMLHPKTIVFFVAFVPQFIHPGGSYASQAVLLAVTFCVVVACTDSAYALAASSAAHLLRRPRASVWSQRAGGTILIAAGVVTAIAR
ncbi:LysE family translocator [Acidisoma silvae]|uniref:LysE family translocator n=1 Tax=Acidisoma silvae TaxID=2802396 RepID=A0A963YX46_9PROT|nr:LysE family translocator [Acidisoma silvae]MCB8878454.1 LysE family translocator [Acidisoma silvae]